MVDKASCEGVITVIILFLFILAAQKNYFTNENKITRSICPPFLLRSGHRVAR
jgi:hypothetical protein